MAKLNGRLDLAHRVFGPNPTRYQIEVARQRLRRDRVVRLARYRVGRL
jgi:hypothetical protein